MPRKKKREVIGPTHCRCGAWFTGPKDEIINVFMHHGDVSCKLCKAPIKNSVYGGRHEHPKKNKRAVRLITKYYKLDHPNEGVE